MPKEAGNYRAKHLFWLVGRSRTSRYAADEMAAANAVIQADPRFPAAVNPDTVTPTQRSVVPQRSPTFRDTLVRTRAMADVTDVMRDGSCLIHGTGRSFAALC